MVKPWTIKEQGIITDAGIIEDLGIIDWSRLNGVWRRQSEAIHSIVSWLINTTRYSIVACNLYDYPNRDDWPGWEHAGAHPELGRLFWNAFHARQTGTLKFGDEPDFCGTITRGYQPNQGKWFWGDIGKVSASAFALIQKGLHAGELWISIPDAYTQVILEPLVSIEDLVSQDTGWGESWMNRTQAVSPRAADSYVQPSLF